METIVEKGFEHKTREAEDGETEGGVGGVAASFLTHNMDFKHIYEDAELTVAAERLALLVQKHVRRQQAQKAYRFVGHVLSERTRSTFCYSLSRFFTNMDAFFAISTCASRYYRDNHLKRCDASGHWYTKQQFIDYYGGEAEWDAAVLTQHAEPETPHQHWHPDVKSMLHAGSDHDETRQEDGESLDVPSELHEPQQDLGQDEAGTADTADMAGESSELQEYTEHEDHGGPAEMAEEPNQLQQE